MNRFALLTVVLLLTVMTSACSNTVEGAGKDMRKAGSEVQSEADEDK